MNSPQEQSEIFIVVEVPPQFRSYIPPALFSVQARYVSHRFLCDGGAITIRGPGDINGNDIRKSVLHAVYREKIYAETLSMRQALISVVTGK